MLEEAPLGCQLIGACAELRRGCPGGAEASLRLGTPLGDFQGHATFLHYRIELEPSADSRPQSPAAPHGHRLSRTWRKQAGRPLLARAQIWTFPKPPCGHGLKDLVLNLDS